MLLWALHLVGPTVLLLAALDVVLRRRARADRQRVTGRIVSWTGHDTPHPTIRFTTLEGREVESTLRANADIGLYPCKEVPVWHDPSVPEQFSTQLWWFSSPGVALTVLGIVLSLVGALFH